MRSRNFQTSKTRGAGIFTSIDRIPVAAGFTRAGTLPIGAVVERAMRDPVIEAADQGLTQKLMDWGLLL